MCQQLLTPEIQDGDRQTTSNCSRTYGVKFSTPTCRFSGLPKWMKPTQALYISADSMVKKKNVAKTVRVIIRRPRKTRYGRWNFDSECVLETRYNNFRFGCPHLMFPVSVTVTASSLRVRDGQITATTEMSLLITN
jgi:hypothetical protein